MDCSLDYLSMEITLYSWDPADSLMGRLMSTPDVPSVEQHNNKSKPLIVISEKLDRIIK